MATDPLTTLLESAAGFGRCGECQYLQGGSPELCSACASRTLEELAPVDRRCEVCDQPYAAGEHDCRNPVCAMGDRWFSWNYAIAMRTGVLQQAINAYKFDGQRGWALVFGRILVGFLDANARMFKDAGLIVSSPTYIGNDAQRGWDHVREIVRMAAQEERSPGWPFDLAEPAAIVKTSDTPRMVGMKYKERRANAEGPLRASLHVPDPSRVRGQMIVVFDDVFTVGLTLREVARALRLAGAADVVGVSLARAPYRG